MSIQIFKKDILTKKFALQNYKLGNVIFVVDRRVRIEDNSEFWISYRYDRECLLEDTVSYEIGKGYSHLALQRTPNSKLTCEQDLFTDYFSLIESINKEPLVSSNILRPYLKGKSDVGAFAFETYGNLSLFLDSYDYPELTISEACEVYEENQEKIKRLTLNNRQENKVWSKNTGSLK